MIFHKISLSDFRNIESLEIVPGEKVNIICGENAQGKTNLMEALWLFTGAKSFRQTKDSEFIRFGAEKANLKADFFSENRQVYPLLQRGLAALCRDQRLCGDHPELHGCSE